MTDKEFFRVAALAAFQVLLKKHGNTAFDFIDHERRVIIARESTACAFALLHQIEKTFAKFDREGGQ